MTLTFVKESILYNIPEEGKEPAIKSGNKNLGATTREEEKHIPRE